MLVLVVQFALVVILEVIYQVDNVHNALLVYYIVLHVLTLQFVQYVELEHI